MPTLNTSAYHRALAAAKRGDIDHGEWSAPTDRDQSDCLGSDKSYPVFSGGKVNAKAVGSAMGYAEKNGAPEIAKAAKAISDAIHKHGIKASRALYLSTGCDDPAQAVPLGLEGYPTKISVKVGDDLKEFPVSYWDKDVIEVGRYTHPETGQQFDVDQDRIDGWVKKFNLMKAAGIEINSPVDHSDRADANKGFVVRARRDGNKLRLTHQIIGEDGALLAARNRASIKINPHFRDEKGRIWEDVIEHSSFTPVPVITGQGSFVPFAASRGEQAATPILYLSATTKESEMDITKLREAIGAAKEITDEQVIAQAVSRIGDAKPVVELSRAQGIEIGELKQKLADAEAKVVQLSRTPDREIMSEWAKLKLAKVDQFLASGQCSPQAGDVIKKHIMQGGEPNVVMLSRIGTSGAPVDAIFEVLELNRTLSGIQQTSHQGVPRVTPGDTGGDAAIIAQADADVADWQKRQLAARGIAAA